MSNKFAIAALGAILSVGLGAEAIADTTAGTQAAKPDSNTEKCFGIVKAGKNDCGSATAQCAGSSTKDNAKDAWILLPKGTCDKIVGGSTKEGNA